MTKLVILFLFIAAGVSGDRVSLASVATKLTLSPLYDCIISIRYDLYDEIIANT